MMATRILVYDDNIGWQEALKLLISNAGDMHFVGARENCNEVEDDIFSMEPQIKQLQANHP